jgi:O-antigen ligase
MSKFKVDVSRAVALGLAGLLGLIVLAYDPGAADAYQLPKVALLRLGALALLAASIKALPAGAFKPTAVDAPALAYLGVCGLFTILSLHSHTSFYGRAYLYAWGFWTLASFGVLFWIASRLDQKKLTENLFAVGLTVGVATLALGLLQGQSAPISTLGTPLNYAGWLAMLMPLGLGALLRVRGFGARLAWALTLLVVIHQLLATLSRSAWLGALAAAGLFLWLNRGQFAQKKQALALAGAVLGAGLLGFGLMGRTTVRERMGVFLSPTETSAQARLGLWKMGLRMMRDHKGWGTGLDTFGFLSPRYETADFRRGTGAKLVATYAHNELLQVGVTMGLLGLAAYAWLWLGWAAAALKRIDGAQGDVRLLSSALLSAAIALWVHSQFNFPSVATAAFQWSVMGSLIPRSEARAAAVPSGARALAFGVCLIAFMAAGLRMGADWRADRLILKSRAALAGRDWNAAVENGEAAVRLNPWGSGYAMSLSNAYRNRGLALRGTPEMERDLASAVDVSRAALERQPLDPDGYHNYAMTLMWSALEAKKPLAGEAADAELKAIELAPKLAALRASLGEIYHFAGRVGEAKRAWLAALLLDPRSTKANSWLERYMPKDVFLISPQDLVGGEVRPGEALDLRQAGAPLLKIVNMKERALRFELAMVAPHETLYEVPEGYAPAPAGTELAPETSVFDLAPNAVRALSLRILIPARSANFGKKFCLLVRARCLSYDVPVDRVVRVFVTTIGKGFKHE